MSAELDEGLIDALLSLEGWRERTLRVTAGQTREGFLASDVLQLSVPAMLEAVRHVLSESSVLDT